jgi:hypothetical protein
MSMTEGEAMVMATPAHPIAKPVPSAGCGNPALQPHCAAGDREESANHCGNLRWLYPALVRHNQQADHEGFPAGCALIEVHVGELKQLFNSMDPTPFRARDLDPRAEEFIAGWASELHADVPLGLVVHVDHGATSPAETAVLQEAVREFFRQRAVVTRRRLRQLLQVGRTSLLIGVAALAASIVLGDIAGGLLADTRFAGIFRESLLIGGWVAMWRPLEVFLYDWWPVRAEARRFDRLGDMTVRIVPAATQ